MADAVTEDLERAAGMPFPAFLALLSGGGPRRYAGPFDSVTGVFAAYGMRRLRSAYTGSLIRLRDTTNNAESDFGYTSTGALDTAAITTFLGGHSAAVVTWYDQSGNGYDVTQATAGSQPSYSASAQNSKPGIILPGGTNVYLGRTSVTWSSTALTSFVVGRSDDRGGNRAFFGTEIGGSSGFVQFDAQSSGAPAIHGGGTGNPSFNVTSTQTFQVDAAWHQHDAQLSGSNCDWLVDGASLAGTAVTGSVTSITDKFAVGADYQTGSPLHWLAGGLAEVVIVAGATSSGTRSTVRANQKAYWGTP